MKQFVYGFVTAAVLAAGSYAMWGRDAVRAGAVASCEQQEDAAAVAERCVLFWFNAEPTQKFDVMKRMCPRERR